MIDDEKDKSAFIRDLPNSEYGAGCVGRSVPFTVSCKLYVDFLTQLDYDGLKAKKFLRKCIELYIAHDERMREIALEAKKDKGLLHLKDRRILLTIPKRDYKKMRKTNKNFGLNKSEVENIFNMIEEETPEL